MSRLSLISKILCSGNVTQLLSSRGAATNKKTSDCYWPYCDSEVFEPEKSSIELCEAGRFMVEEYFPHEPLMFANKIRPTQTLILFFQQAALKGNLIYCTKVTKGGSIKLGMAIAHPLSPTAVNDLKTLAGRIKDKPTRNYFSLLAELERKINMLAMYKTDKIMSIDVLATGLHFRRRGISKLILNGLLEAACNQKYDVVRLITSSEYAFKAATSVGFVPAYQGDPEMLRDESGEALAPTPLCLPHKLMRIMIKDIRLKK